MLSALVSATVAYVFSESIQALSVFLPFSQTIAGPVALKAQPGQSFGFLSRARFVSEAPFHSRPAGLPAHELLPQHPVDLDINQFPEPNVVFAHAALVSHPDFS